MGMWHTSCKRQAAKQPRKQQQLSTDAPVAQNSNRVELLGLSMGQQGCREEGRGREASTHSQAVVLPLILLTRSSFYATQPVAQVAPVPHHPPPSLSLSLPYFPSAYADGNQSATAGALASHLAPDFWLNVTTAAASPDAF